jgi:hypothetical protein
MSGTNILTSQSSARDVLLKINRSDRGAPNNDPARIAREKSGGSLVLRPVTGVDGFPVGMPGGVPAYREHHYQTQQSGDDRQQDPRQDAGEQAQVAESSGTVAEAVSQRGDQSVLQLATDGKEPNGEDWGPIRVKPVRIASSTKTPPILRPT